MGTLTQLAITVVANSIPLYNAKRNQYVHQFRVMPVALKQAVLKRALRRGHVNDESILLFFDEHTTAISLSGGTIYITDVAIRALQIAGPRLREISLFCCYAVAPDALCALFSATPCIRMVNLAKCTAATDLVIDTLSAHCHELRTLVLNRTSRVTDSALQRAFSGNSWPHFAELSVLGCLSLTGKFLGKLSKANGNTIQIVNISRCTGITDKKWVVKLIQRCRKLVSLKVNKLRCLDDGVLYTMAECLSDSLVRLDIANCQQLSEDAIVNLISRCTRLRSLTLPLTTDPVLVAIATHVGASLEELLMANTGLATDNGLAAIAGHAAVELRILNLSRCKHISDCVVIGLLAKCRQLEELYLTQCDQLTDAIFTAHDDQSNSAASTSTHDSTGVLSELKILEISQAPQLVLHRTFFWLAQHCHQLETLNVGSTPITSAAIEFITTTHFPRLRNIHSRCTPIGDYELSEIVRQCRSLTSLQLSETGITTVGLVLMLQYLTALESLNVGWCALLSELPLVASDYPPLNGRFFFESLHMNGCSNLSPLAVNYAVQSASSIQSLVLSGCTRLDEPGLVGVIALPACRHLQFLDISKIPAVTDACVLNIVHTCQCLVSFNVAMCTAVTTVSASKVLRELRWIKTVHFTGCQLITNEALEACFETPSVPPLELVAIKGTAITKDAALRLSAAIPSLQIHY